MTKLKGKKCKIKYWYELFNGPKNAEGLMIKLEQAALFEFTYRNCSSYSHGEDLILRNLESNDNNTFGISF